MKNISAVLDDSTPRYLQLTEDMRRQVREGILRPGDRLPSISQLRASYGIAKSTIERAHLLLEQEGLIVREHGRGTFVADVAARRFPDRKGIVGVYGLLETWASCSSYWPHIMEGVREALQVHQSHVMLFLPEALGVQDKADGVLLNGEYVRPQTQWLEEDWPCVSLLEDRGAHISSVVGDVAMGSRLAIEHLVSLGHRRIAYLHNESDENERRYHGYCDAMTALGIDEYPQWVYGFEGPDVAFREFGHDAMRTWIKKGWRDLGCTALLAHNDAVAAGAMDALQEAGYDIPGDVSIVGADGTTLCQYVRPQLTTVAVPLRQIGKRGAEILMDQINNGTGEIRHIILPTRLVVRESTAPPANA